MVLVRARCGGSERSERRVARHSHFTGRLARLFPNLAVLPVKQENNRISVCCVTSAPFTSKEAPPHPRQSGHWEGVQSTAVIQTDTPLKIPDTEVRQLRCQLLWSRILSLEINPLSALPVFSFPLLLNAELSILMEKENLGGNFSFRSLDL